MWNGHGREEKPNECNVCGMTITETTAAAAASKK